MVMYLSAQGEGKLLEVGCGRGDMLKLMQEMGWHVEGVDFDHKAVQNAQKKGLRVSCGALEAQAYPDNQFDAITMSHLIEHVHDPVQLLNECYRILRPGGRVVIVTPNSDSWGHRKFASSWRGLEPPRHLHIFNHQSLTILSQNVGFRIERSFTTIRNANAQFIASRSLRLSGKHVWGSPQPWAVRKWGKMMMFIEWGILKVSSIAGEEIVLILEK
jgi:ubiquinone/menaquinone biosynthesis C-methylase UbiE